MKTAIEAAYDRIADLEGAAKADEARMIAAAKKARVVYFGCDTPDHMADRIAELEEALIEERAKQLNVDEPCPGRTSYEHCTILDDICDGYPDMWAVCPRKKEKLSAAKDELHSEGKI